MGGKETCLICLLTAGILWILWQFQLTPVSPALLSSDRVSLNGRPPAPVVTEPHEQREIVPADLWVISVVTDSDTPNTSRWDDLPWVKRVVVGVGNVNINCRPPNCTFLPYQNSSSYATLRSKNSNAAKNIGYLYAISKGAKFIYDTTEKIHAPLKLSNFVLNQTTWGLLYNDSQLFNPYFHFGQLTLQPSFYPLAQEKRRSKNYLLNLWKTPDIQQGFVFGGLVKHNSSGEIFDQKLIQNMELDSRAPPVVIPRSRFTHLNSQNTLFFYDAFWALLLPLGPSVSVSEITRGFWAQRLLWEIGSCAGVVYSTSVQLKTTYSDSERNYSIEKLVQFLKDWKCEKQKTFFDCVVKLTEDMVSATLFEDTHIRVVKDWLNDLQILGYKEPKRVPETSLEYGSQYVPYKRINHQLSKPKQMKTLFYFPAEQTPPKASQTVKDRLQKWHINTIESFCRNSSLEVHFKTPFGGQTYPNILLVVTYNQPHYENIPSIELLYRNYFPHIVYCGGKLEKFLEVSKTLPYHVTYLNVDTSGGLFPQLCLLEAMKMNYKMDGYFYIGDDTLINPWNFKNLSVHEMWFRNDGNPILRQSLKKPDWMWFNIPNLGLKTYQAAINQSKYVDKERFDNFFRILKENTGFDDGFYQNGADIVYVSEKYKEDFLFFMDYFFRFTLFQEMTLPLVVFGIEKSDKVYQMSGMYLWYDGKREHYDKYYSKDHIFLHPVKVNPEKKKKQGQKFLCEQYYPLTLT